MKNRSNRSTYSRLLLPENARMRVWGHLLFWLAFIGYHMIFFIPILPERVMNADSRLAFFLYYLRFIPIYYGALALMHVVGQPSQRWFSPILVLMSCMLVMHVITKPLYHFYENHFGLKNLPKNFQLIGKYYLQPWIPTKKGDLGAYVYDLMDMQLLALPFGLKWLRMGAMISLTRSEIERNKLETELKELRALLTPHFILNVLNAASTEVAAVSAKTSEYLIHAADVIRFALYDARYEFIELGRELEFISHYLRLEVIRTGRRSTITFDVHGQASQGQRVPTLLISTLIENAIKHGVHSTPEPSYVKIDCRVEQAWLTIQVFNSKPSHNHQVQEKSDQGGLGLTSLRRRLEGYFPGRHLFRVTDRPESFMVYLQIPLKP